MQTVSQKVLENTMFYRDIAVFIYKIRYPCFTTTCSAAAVRKINQYYACTSRATEHYCKTVLYPQAVESARYIQNNQQIPFNSYEMDVQFTVSLNHDSISSLYHDQYTYMGGAHGMTLRESDTWDFFTGFRIWLQTFYSGDSSYPESIFKEIERQIAERLKISPSSYFDDYPTLIREHFNPKSYYLEPRNIVIYYQQYDIAPYATGIPEFRLPYPENITSRMQNVCSVTIVLKEVGSMQSVIYHIDVNSAFLSWEAAYRLHHLGGTLDLRTIPSAVSGDMAARHGIILAKSVPAKRFGIHTGQTVLEARQKCPALYMVPPNYGLYQKCSDAFIKLLGEYTPSVEQYSIDEAFMDMSSTMHLFGSPADTARNIRDRIREELGFTVNIGISSNKLLAKMASGFRKPDRVHTLFPEEIQEKMWPLPVSDLFFVGRATASKLLKLGIRTIGELAASDPGLLSSHLKKHGEVVWAFANGIDFSSVEPDPPPQKGYGNSTTIAFDVTDMETAHLVLLGLAETVGSRLRENQVQAELMSVGIKSFDLSYASHQMILDNPTNITTELYRFACRLFDHLWDGRTAIRHLGIHTGRLQDGMALRQMSLFDTADYAKLETWDSTIDSIRKRYGMDAVRRAAFLDTPIDHLEGGISREKRDVDYSRLCIQ